VEPGDPVAQTGPAAPDARPPLRLAIDPVLDAAIARDLRRGRRVASITWPIALLHGALGFIALQQAGFLAGIDRHLATTPQIEAYGAGFLAVRVALVAAIAVSIALAFRWLRAAVVTAGALADLGTIEAGPRGEPQGEPRGEPPRPAALADLGLLFRPAGPVTEPSIWDIRVGSGRRRASLAVLTIVVATVVGLAGAVGSIVAGDADGARFARWLTGIDAGLWILGMLLLGAVASDVAWRIAVAGRAAGHYAPLVDAPGRTLVRLAPAMLLFIGLLPIAARPPTAQDIPCRATSLHCAQVVVPVDHGGPAVQPVINVVYGVHRAVGAARGTLVVAVGGPGGSGLGSADWQIDTFDPRLVQNYDIVFWDQRGVGRSDGHDCPVAGGIYSAVEANDTTARAFVDACLREADTGSSGLGRYSTRQAAEDLESIRESLGIAKFALYGESYGTELAQVYAAAHPDRLTALILDGSVDLTLTANQFWAAAARSFDATLKATFDECGQERLCRNDVVDPAGAYDRLLERLGRKPEVISYRDVTGQLGDHRLEGPLLQRAVAALMYEPTGRALVLRAIASAAAGDDVPIARLADLFGPGIGGAVSSFAYHAVLCADYRVSPTADTTDFAAVLQAGRSSGALSTRTGDVYFAQVPCLYWPDQPTADLRPAPLTDQPEPIFVLGATLDPITPIEMGRAIAARARDGYLIESSGGPHVTFGRGHDCVDGPIVDFLVDGTLPTWRTIHCSDVVASPYIAVHPIVESGYTDALDAMHSVEDELFADPIFALTRGQPGLTIGCRYGGFVTVDSTDVSDEFGFEGCEFASGMPLDGTGRYDADSTHLDLDLTFPDGDLHYTSDGVRHVTGTFRGTSVDQRG
jgi:pimeloyl-ACP methyl ester carboxylesterase